MRLSYSFDPACKCLSVLTIDTLAAPDYLRVMARRLRIQYPGAMYRVMNRWDQPEALFQDDEDRQKFLATLGEACEQTDWQVQADCLMSNHFHLVLERPQPNLGLGMKWRLGVSCRRNCDDWAGLRMSCGGGPKGTAAKSSWPGDCGSKRR